MSFAAVSYQSPNLEGASFRAMQILAVVVRYNTPLEESETFRGLSAALTASSDLAQAYKLLIWDNSAQALSHLDSPIPFEYRHSERNLGVSGAYNSAMHYAITHGHTWMLLLDQDTTVTGDFLRTMLRHSRELEARAEIAAITPTVQVGNFIVSPRQQLFNRNRPYPQNESGKASGEAFAINSGCVMRTAALQECGGFSLEFWLDYSDMYVFHQFFLHGKQVWRAADAELEHDMSIMDYDRLMTPQRYRNFSHAESAFNDLYKSWFENAVQNLRLLVRAIKQRRKYKNPEFSRIAWQQLRYRLQVPRHERLARWGAAGDMRRIGAHIQDIPMGRRLPA